MCEPSRNQSLFPHARLALSCTHPKSPASDATGINGMRLIERNIRKAARQFEKVEGGPVRPSIVVLNCSEVNVSRDAALKRVHLEMKRHDIDRVILITKGDVIDDIRK